MHDDFADIIAATPRILLRTDMCRSTGDPKLDGKPMPIYVPTADFQQAKKSVSNPAQLIELPEGFAHAPFYGPEAEHGLLYLPYPYLVAGGRFNEMFGWDTAFPIFAWTDREPQIMREQADNQLYQIRAYGKVLNGNRTYYLSRSHPPFLSAMIMCIWRESLKRDWADFDPDHVYKDNRDWLSQALPLLIAYHTYFTTGSLLAGDTGLSRYWDEGTEPAPEVLGGEHGLFHHAHEFYKHNAISTDEQEDANLFYSPETDTLTPLYHRANRTMRASGFDPTGHWGYGALRCMFHAPTCLNSLLYRMETDLAEISDILGSEGERERWLEIRAVRKANMQEFLFNPDTGAYLDYDFSRKRLNTKPLASLFHSLWAGVYDPETDKEAVALLVRHALEQLETPRGIVTSPALSGSQWDYPNGWAPLHYLAFTGLARYGYIKEARRIATKYLNLTQKVLSESSTLFEKYNVVEGNAEIHVVNGYDTNVSERGTFLWTAATATLAQKLLDQ